MVESDTTFLRKEDVLGLIRESADPLTMDESRELLQQLVSHNLIQNASGRISFWHISLRDYFASVALQERANPLCLLRLAFLPRWRESLLFLISNLEESDADRFLSYLVFSIKLVLLPLVVAPMRSPGSFLFFALRCLGECDSRRDHLKDRLIDQIARRSIFLASDIVTIQFPDSNKPSPREELYYLIGKLMTPKAYIFLSEDVAELQFRAWGLRFYRDERAADKLLELIQSTPNSFTARRIMSVLLTFPLEIVLPRFVNIIESDAGGASYILELMNGVLARFDLWTKRLKMTLRTNSEWIDVLTYKLINHEDDTVRDSCEHILRKLGSEGILPSVESALIDALCNGTDDQKYNSIWPLVYSNTMESIDALSAALRADDVFIQFRCLSALWIRDRKKYPDYVEEFLLALAPENLCASDSFRELQDTLSSLEGGSRSKDIRQAALFVLFIIITFQSELDLIRLNCIKALGELSLKSTENVLALVLREDKSDRAREMALRMLGLVLGEKVEVYLDDMLNDSSAVVRRAAVSALWHLPVASIKKRSQIIRIINKEDEEKSVRTTAGALLYHLHDLDPSEPLPFVSLGATRRPP